jgi:hypothetical protein
LCYQPISPVCQFSSRPRTVARSAHLNSQYIIKGQEREYTYFENIDSLPHHVVIYVDSAWNGVAFIQQGSLVLRGPNSTRQVCMPGRATLTHARSEAVRHRRQAEYANVNLSRVSHHKSQQNEYRFFKHKKSRTPTLMHLSGCFLSLRGSSLMELLHAQSRYFFCQCSCYFPHTRYPGFSRVYVQYHTILLALF